MTLIKLTVMRIVEPPDGTPTTKAEVTRLTFSQHEARAAFNAAVGLSHAHDVHSVTLELPRGTPCVHEDTHHLEPGSKA